MKRQQGFTLIELVAVIVLLGILAVTALPRFVNLQGDARASVIRGVAGSMQAAGAQVYARALILGRERANPGTVDAAGVNVQTSFGYPQAVGDANNGIVNLLQLDTSGGLMANTGTADADTTRLVGYDRNGDGNVTAADECHVLYTQSTAENTPPVITVDPDRC